MSKVQTQFYQDILSGLSKHPKCLPSKYFYDDEGDRLFQEIMQLEEYYLPEAELEILDHYALHLAKFPAKELQILELGAGDGTKTRHWLKRLRDNGQQFKFFGFDISASVLIINQANMQSTVPNLNWNGVPGDYRETLPLYLELRPKLILLFGGNIGNYPGEEATQLLRSIRAACQSGDQLLVSFDLKKNPMKILAAYNDASGVTKAFNLNLLARINRELGADFQLAQFEHYPSYDPISGYCKSFLVSQRQQTVHIQDRVFQFESGEIIHTEVSQKYDLESIESIGKEAGFSNVIHFLDAQQQFSISRFEIE